MADESPPKIQRFPCASVQDAKFTLAGGRLLAAGTPLLHNYRG
jgi:hypothetical protein